MSVRFRRMAARLWPASLFGRLAIILFSGLVAAHVLAFVLIALDRLAIEDELGSKFAAGDIADAVAILDHVEPEERPAWLDRLSRRHWRYILSDEGELEAETPKRRQANIARLRAALGPDHDANFVHFDPPQRLRRGIRMHLKDGSPVTIEIFWQGPVISPWLPAALAAQLCIIAFFVWLAIKLATQPLARLEHAAHSLGSDCRSEPLPEDGPKEVARAATALNAMQRRIAEQVAERIQILAAISHDLQTPITRMRLRADFLGDSDAREKLQGDLQEMQTLVKQGLALARDYDGIGPTATAHVAVEASREPS
ncbi:histidine kinase dimerization/phospho-acceptor domain-containing protein [Bradyrhizobium roseum]|uniref:histidine kinase dimerization/phospho-acceptor domain-containing protein n=1 Tax=Bradyrhizobium roseum TaxID=3056648 RepID=UPI002633AEAC|nr:histidine kinase dimerization/phospho-acceptor domain-containing protein [Bradyrhizobium roseus]WKA26094.1 HAMP domain-containing protein [Bradyrhizobium roseus]